MLRPFATLSLLSVLLVCAPVSGLAQAPSDLAAPDTTVRYVIGTKPAPPFAILQDDGTWTGLSVELWQDIAADLNLDYRWQEASLEGLLEGIQADSLDASVAALTITAAREQAVDFSHPFFVSGLGIAVRVGDEAGFWATLKRLVSLNFVKVIAALLALLGVVGALVWLFERRRNPEQFGGSAAQGLGAAFWWSAVTMTTVGYGDKAPVTVGGRLVALVWMFAAIIIASSFTAAITSALTVSQLEAAVQGPEDLPDVAVGTVDASSTTGYLDRERVGYEAYPSVEDGLIALRAGEIEAFVYDAPILQYAINQGFRQRLRVLPGTFETQYYGIALPKGSRLREPVNRLLLEKIESSQWQDRLYRYLGE